MVKLGHHVTVFLKTRETRKSSLFHSNFGARICKIRLPLTEYLLISPEHLHSMPWLGRNFMSLIHIFEQSKFDVLYARFIPLSPWATYLARRFAVPLVFEVNDLPITGANRIALKDCVRQLSAAKAIITSTMSQKRLLAELVDTPIHVVNLGVDPERFNPSVSPHPFITRSVPEDTKLVVFSGSFAPWAGSSLLPQIAERVLDEYLSCKFLVLGGVPPGEFTKQSFSSKKLSDKADVTPSFVFAGWCPHYEVPSLLVRADVCLHLHVATHDQAFWLATGAGGAAVKLFEYMAMGKPIVTFDYPEIRNVLQNAGMYAKPCDVSDVADKIICLLKNYQFRMKLGNSAREKVINKYTWSHTAMNVSKVFKCISNP